MDIQGVRAFVTVADAGSVQRAADHLGYSQSAVSRQLTAFERSVGGRVFDRRREGMHLTDLGSGLYPLACHMLEVARTMATGADRRTASA